MKVKPSESFPFMVYAVPHYLTCNKKFEDKFFKDQQKLQNHALNIEAL